MQPLSYTNKSLNFFPFFKVSTLWLIEVIFQYLETTWMKIDRFVTLYTLLCRKEGSKYYRKKNLFGQIFLGDARENSVDFMVILQGHMNDF